MNKERLKMCTTADDIIQFANTEDFASDKDISEFIEYAETLHFNEEDIEKLDNDDEFQMLAAEYYSYIKDE